MRWSSQVLSLVIASTFNADRKYLRFFYPLFLLFPPSVAVVVIEVGIEAFFLFVFEETSTLCFGFTQLGSGGSYRIADVGRFGMEWFTIVQIFLFIVTPHIAITLRCVLVFALLWCVMVRGSTFTLGSSSYARIVVSRTDGLIVVVGLGLS